MGLGRGSTDEETRCAMVGLTGLVEDDENDRPVLDREGGLGLGEPDAEATDEVEACR